MPEKMEHFLGPENSRSFLGQKLLVHNGRVWEQSKLHLKSAIPKFNRRNIAKLVALDLLREQFRV